MKQNILIGNYSDKGIYRFEFKENTSLVEIVKIGNDKNSSYICKYKNYIYSVKEINGDERINSGYVVAYEKKENEIKFINSTISYGSGPCFLAVDDSRGILYIANYSGGSFVAFKLEENGGIGKKIYYKKFENESKIHHIQFSKDYKKVYIVDLGNDCIIEYDINYTNNELSLKEKFKLKFQEKSEPRHIAIDAKNNIYVVTEKSCEIYKLAQNERGQLEIIEKKSILPKETVKKDDYTGCAIKIDSENKFMYVSIRGHNSISVFEIKDENIKLIQNIECGGKTPRDIAFDKYEKYLFCANQSSNNITVFSIQNGKLIYQSEYKIESPTCIVIE